MAIDDADIRALGEEIKKAIGGTTGDDPASRRKRRQAIEELVEDEKGIKLTKLSNAQIKVAVKNAKLKDGIDKETIATLQNLNNRLDELGSTIRESSSTVVGFGKALYRGEGTISSYTDVVAGKFGLVGDAIAGTGRLLDTNIEMFRQLAQTGANFGQSIIQMRTAAAGSALPLDDFARLVGSNSEALAALRGSATQGAEFIAGLSNALRTDAVPQLATLGFTVDEINETMLLNLERQRRTGMFDANATQFNIDSAIRFGKQLDRLAKLTGVQRDQLQKEIEAAQSNERFQAFLQGTTEETRQRLDTFAGTISTLAPGLAEGMQDLIANAGVPVTDSALALVQNIPEARKVVQDLINGSITTEQALIQMRDASSKSVDRFKSATVTGQVEFLRLQGDVINLGKRLMDVNAVLAETAPEMADNITTGLTQFEDASKRMGSATQSLETAFLAFTGNLLGDATSAVNTGLTGLSKAILGLPGFIAAGLYGTGKLLQGGLALLKDTGPTYLAVRTGVAHGMGKSAGLRAMFGGMKGGIGGFAKSGGKMLGRAGGVGLGLMGAGYFGGMAGKKDATGGEKAMGVLGSAASGAMIGSMFLPGWGTAIGGALGAAYGGYKALTGKQFGGTMGGGVPHLVGETGPEIVTTKTASSVTADMKLEKMFNTEALEVKMASMVTELNSANKTLTNMVNGVNTLVAIENRSMKAVESTARKDRNQVGFVS